MLSSDLTEYLPYALYMEKLIKNEYIFDRGTSPENAISLMIVTDLGNRCQFTRK